jgi:hypothetical protein
VRAGSLDDLPHALVGPGVAGHREAADLGGDRRRCVWVEIVHRYPGAAVGQPTRQRAADPSSAAGDDGTGSVYDRHVRTITRLPSQPPRTGPREPAPANRPPRTGPREPAPRTDWPREADAYIGQKAHKLDRTYMIAKTFFLA